MFKFLIIFFISINLIAEEHQEKLMDELSYWKDLLEQELINQTDYDNIKKGLLAEYIIQSKQEINEDEDTSLKLDIEKKDNKQIETKSEFNIETDYKVILPNLDIGYVQYYLNNIGYGALKIDCKIGPNTRNKLYEWHKTQKNKPIVFDKSDLRILEDQFENIKRYQITDLINDSCGLNAKKNSTISTNKANSDDYYVMTSASVKDYGNFFCTPNKGLKCDETQSGMTIRYDTKFFISKEIYSENDNQKYYEVKYSDLIGTINGKYLKNFQQKKVTKKEYNEFVVSSRAYSPEVIIKDSLGTKYVTIAGSSSSYVSLDEAYKTGYSGYIPWYGRVSLKAGTELRVVEKIYDAKKNKEFYIVDYKGDKYFLDPKKTVGESSIKTTVVSNTYEPKKEKTKKYKKKETPEEKALRIKRSQFLMKLGNSLMNGQGVAGALNDFNSSSYNQNKNLEPTFDETPGWGMLIESYPSGLNTLCLYDTNRGVFTKTLNSANAVCPPTL